MADDVKEHARQREAERSRIALLGMRDEDMLTGMGVEETEPSLYRHYLDEDVSYTL